MTVHVLVVAGSAADDFYAELSLLYARGSLDALRDDRRYRFSVAYVTPDGRWRFPRDLSPEAIRSAPPVGLAGAVHCLAEMRPDVALPQMFCVPGMTRYRALLELLGIPYAGNTPEVMALTADKVATRAVVAAAGVAVPEGEVLRRGDRPALRPPLVVKPATADNSLGVTVVTRDADLGAALDTAFGHDGTVLVERFIGLGREVRCGVLAYGGRLLTLPLEEYAIDPAAGIRGHDDKLLASGGGGLAFAAKSGGRSWIIDPGDPVTAAVQRAALTAHVALGCRHYSLFDFRIDPAGRPWFLEAGLYCSFSPTSVLTTMAGAAGIPLHELFATAMHEAGSYSA